MARITAVARDEQRPPTFTEWRYGDRPLIFL